MTILEYFFKAFDICRKKRGLAQKQVAELVGIHENDMSRYRNAKRGMDDDLKAKVADFFGYDLLDFLNLGRIGAAAATAEVLIKCDSPLPDPPPPYVADLADIKNLLTEHLVLAKVGRAEDTHRIDESKKRIEEFIEHIETLKKGVEARDSQIVDLQNKFNSLMASRNAEINRLIEEKEYFKAQIERVQADRDTIQADRDTIRGLFENEKKISETDLADIARFIRMLPPNVRLEDGN